MLTLGARLPPPLVCDGVFFAVAAAVAVCLLCFFVCLHLLPYRPAAAAAACRMNEKELNHSNIVRMLGASWRGPQPMIIVSIKPGAAYFLYILVVLLPAGGHKKARHTTFLCRVRQKEGSPSAAVTREQREHDTRANTCLQPPHDAQAKK